MSTTDRLSNDAILGLDLDADFALDPSIVQPSVAGTGISAGQGAAGRPKRRSDKLTADILLAGRGIPKLLDTFRRFRFAKRPKTDVLSVHSSRKSLLHSNAARYGDDHHYKNLQRILATYQAFGHTLSPHLKFDRFIANLARGADDPYTKAWIRDQTREEMRAKMEKQTAIEAVDADAEVSRTATATTTATSATASADAVDDNDGEQWPELFGGEPTTTAAAADNDDSADLSHIRQTPMFSTFLRTSSQPIPSEEDMEELDMDSGAPADAEGVTAGDMDAFDALAAAETGFEDLLHDVVEEGENDDADSALQAGQFSQYLAQDLSSPPPAAAEPAAPAAPTGPSTQASNTSFFSDDDFSDDDDDAALRL